MCWNAPQQGAGTYDIIARVAEDGDVETRDYLDLEYSIDGERSTTLANVQGQTSAHTLVGAFTLDGRSDAEDWQHATLRVA